MFVDEASHLVYIIVDDYVQTFLDASGFFDIVGGELLRHVGWTLEFGLGRRLDCGLGVILRVSTFGGQQYLGANECL